MDVSFPESFPLDFQNYLKAHRYSFQPPTDTFGSWVFFGTTSNHHTTNWEIQDKIKSLFLNHEGWSPLCQFWQAVEREGRCFLTTRNQPFRLEYVDTYDCKYRMACEGYELDVDEEEGLGIPGRVFKNRSIESTPNIKHYTIPEHPLRGVALDCDISISLAFPVFESSSSVCVGVIEVADYYGAYFCGYPSIYEELKEVRLEALKRHHVNQVVNEELKEALRVACEIPDVYMAQAWQPCSACDIAFTAETNMGVVLQEKQIQIPYYLDILYDASPFHHLRKGQGIVGRALSYNKLSLCADIKNFPITDWPFAHYLLEISDQIGCLAICLQSSNSGNNIHVLEFLFKIVGDSDDQLFLILKRMKKCLPSFILASGQTLGEELPIVIIDSHKNERHYFLQIPEMREAIQQPHVEQQSGKRLEDSAASLGDMRDKVMSSEVTSKQEMGERLLVEMIDSYKNERQGVRQLVEEISSYPQDEIWQSIERGEREFGILVSSAIMNEDLDSMHVPDGWIEPSMDLMNNENDAIKEQNDAFSSFSQQIRTTITMGRQNGKSGIVVRSNLKDTAGSLGAALGIECGESGCPSNMSNMNVKPESMHIANEMEMVHEGFSGQPLVEPMNTKIDDATVEPNAVCDSYLQQKGATKSVEKRCRKSGIQITLKDIKQQFGKNIQDAANSLGVSRSTFKRACRQHEIFYWRFGKRSKGPPNVDFGASIEDTARGQVPISNMHPRTDPTHQSPKDFDTSQMQKYMLLEGTRNVDIKVKYGNKSALKFQLSLTSRIADLHQQLVKRLNGIDLSNYKIQYRDEEDDWIKLACDEDLQHYLSTSTLSRQTTITLYLEPVNNP